VFSKTNRKEKFQDAFKLHIYITPSNTRAGSKYQKLYRNPEIIMWARAKVPKEKEAHCPMLNAGNFAEPCLGI
jgi:hypothetical protein